MINILDNDVVKRKEIHNNAVKYISDNYTWESIMGRFNEVIQSCSR